MKSTVKECYYAAAYTRLSKEDGDKAESDSINNQKELIRNFHKSHPEINIVQEYSDDGYSGVDFERPDFMKMIEDVKAKEIDCIIVKDLSRFGRNYIETGKYIEQLFPFLGVRFIAINDDYDSASVKNQSEQMILPFKNLINDIYCRDISIKVRSNLNAKRKKGDYVGAFAPYGYKKSEDDKNKLVVDEQAAKVVKRIFTMKIEGKSTGRIVEVLNNEAVPAPYEYKRHTEQGKNFKPSFAVNSNPIWSTSTILRILENEVYLGHLIQGKSVRPNYKVKKQIEVESSDMIRVENTHPLIINREEFQLVRKLLLLDTRVSPGKENLHLFSGLLYCEKCGEPLIRRTISTRNGKYIYYGCYTKGKKQKCKGVAARETLIETTLLEAIKKQVQITIEMEELLSSVDQMALLINEVKTLDDQIKGLEEELVRYKRIKASLYEDYRDGIIGRSEYIELKAIYDQEQNKRKPIIQNLTEKRQNILMGESDNQKCINLFKQYRNITELDRRTLLVLISRVDVHSKKKISIRFSYQDEFDKMIKLMRQLGGGSMRWPE